MHTLTLFGGLHVRGPHGPLSGRIAQRRQLALLALLGVQPGRPMARDRLLPVLWPEVDTERARRSLSDALWVIRSTLGGEAVRSVGDDVFLDPDLIDSDVRAFESALATGRPAEAVAQYAGPFLDGFHLANAPEFEDWIESERSRLFRSCLAAIERVACDRHAEGDRAGAVEAWRRAAAFDPHNSRIALHLVRALAEAGDTAGALRNGQRHAELVEREYGVAPPAELTGFIGQLRAAASRTSAGRQPSDSPVFEGAAPDRPDPGFEADDAGQAAEARGVAARSVAFDPGINHDLAVNHDPATGEGNVQSPAEPVSRRPRPRAIGVVLVACALTVVIAMSIRSGGDDLDDGLVFTTPLRTGGMGPGWERLGAGLAELVAARLTGEERELRALPGVRSAGDRQADDHQPPSADARAMRSARRSGAGRLLAGAVVGTAERLAVTLSVLDTRTGEQKLFASAEGAESDLPALADRLVAELLSRSAGVREDRIPDVSARPLEAVRPFVAARRAHRRGDYEEALRLYSRALHADSTFAIAGLEVRAVGGWVGGSGPIVAAARGIVARNARRLGERDRAALESASASAGEPTTVRSRLARIQRRLSVWDDDARFWYLNGDLHMHNGRAIGIGAADSIARLSFERAVEIDPGYADPVHHLATMLATTGDTDSLRSLVVRQVDGANHGSVPDYLRWLANVVLRDSTFAAPPPDSMDTDATLRWIGIVSQDYGFGIDDGELAVQARLDRPGTDVEVGERRMGAYSFALNRGRPAAALAQLDALEVGMGDSDKANRLRILANLYADGPDVAAWRAARELASSTAAGMTAELNRCTLTLWDLRPGSTAVVPRPRILTDAEAVSADTGGWAVERRICALVRDATWLAREGSDEWHAATRRLEALFDLGPILGLVDGGEREYGHIALARLHRAAGSPHAALAALDRRARYNGWQPWLATSLIEEARLAVQVRDFARAIPAYMHYLAFRTEPDAELGAEVLGARLELEQLVRSLR